MKLITFIKISFFASIFFSSAFIAQTEGEKSKLTEVWEPIPLMVKTDASSKVPSDAIILLGENGTEEWVHKDGSAAKWKYENGVITVVKKSGSLKTKRKFGDCQLHVEWRTPKVVSGEGQGRGNSGVFLQERYEVQVLDSYVSRTYSNGQAGSIYKQYIPLVNASRGPGEWQEYDIIFDSPEFSEDGSLIKPGYITVIHNGVLIQNHVELKGTTSWVGAPKYEPHGAKESITLQDHGNPVSYRNIWIREL